MRAPAAPSTEERGLRRGLKSRHLQMIAIGGTAGESEDPRKDMPRE